ncbi:MAG: hypothetical protein CML24_14710 [Rhizobiales bacterium]|nr:hypothetical protein [Hyphomicrobiales bacterium]
MLTLEEAADYCGLSPNSFKGYIRISPTNFGRAVRYDRKAIDRYLDGMMGEEDLQTRVDRVVALAGKNSRRK